MSIPSDTPIHSDHTLIVQCIGKFHLCYIMLKNSLENIYPVPQYTFVESEWLGKSVMIFWYTLVHV